MGSIGVKIKEKIDTKCLKTATIIHFGEKLNQLWFQVFLQKEVVTDIVVLHKVGTQLD